MPNVLLETTVRPDWPEIEQREAAERARIWRWAQAGVAAYALVALFLLPNIGPTLRPLVASLLLCGVLWALPLWFIVRQADANTALRASLTGCGLLAGSIVMATLGARAPGQAGMVLAALMPLAGWTLVYRARRSSPRTARALGMSTRAWLHDAIMGAAAGAALGFHLWITLGLLHTTPAPHWPSGPTAFWLLCYLAGFRALGQELLFRGLGYHLLGGAQASLLRVAARIALVEVFLYLAPAWGTTDPAVWLGGLLYGALLSAVATVLRAHRGSLIPGLACNIVFGLFTAFLSLR